MGIPNPGYKGVWKAKKIANPKYDASEVDSLYAYDEFAFVGMDLWQVRGVAKFDDILITNDDNEAKRLEEVWKERVEAERKKKTEEADAKKEAEEKKEESSDIDTDDD